MKLFNVPFCAGIGQENERLNMEKIDRLKQEAEIDRSETCFAGKGRIGSKHLTPIPEYSERLRRRDYL